jgi:hypothetical protein
MARVIAAQSGKAGSLDYVGAWFIKAGDYLKDANASIGFVSTNSITQGEQVAQLWPILFDRCKLEIAFAHRTFAWGSDARGKAHVHVVIIGLVTAKFAPKMKRLFSYIDINGDPQESQHGAISPYLFDASNLANSHIVVQDSTKPLSDRPRMMRGVQSTDGGHYIFRGSEKEDFIALEPQSAKFMRPYIGAQEYLQGKDRWILFLEEASPKELKAMPHVLERIRAVREMRLASKKPATNRLAETPNLLEGRFVPDKPFLAIPQVSSERREYVPFGWLEPPTIPSDKLRFIEDISLSHFGVLISSMHMAWMRTVTGRLESRYMYSVGVVYNTYPMPQASDAQLAKLDPLAQAILDARASHTGSTLADIYDPDLMPANLRKAHNALDKAVDKLYRKSGFSSDSERVEHLLGMYEKMIVPLTAPVKKKRRKNKRKDNSVR